MENDLSAPRIADWVRFYEASPLGYKPHALSAVLQNDGQKVLVLVLKKLKLEQSSELVKDWIK